LSIEDKYEGVKELITLGKERGYLLYDEVNDVLPEDLTSSEDLDNIFYLFGDAGIEVIDSEQQFEGAEKKGQAKEDGEEQDHELSSESLDKTNDPVRMYLREMGTVPLLTRDGEVEIAKRIERGQKTVLKALSRSPVVVAEVLGFAEELKKHNLAIKDLVNVNEEEITQEVLDSRRRGVLRRINKIRHLELEAVKVRERLNKVQKHRKAYKRLLSQLARYRIPMAREIRNVGLNQPTYAGLVATIKSTVDRFVAQEREGKKLKKLHDSTVKLIEAKKDQTPVARDREGDEAN
jgi:RNA polymerase primary sigma factor